ncbi:MAG: murein biosynthesis integral membrane protein MurJ [Terriglobales bacterium]
MVNSGGIPDRNSLSAVRRLLRLFRPSHQHTAFSATLLVMAAVMLSRVIGYVRDAYIAWRFGAGPATDAYFAAFTIPDFLNYLVAGGAVSITFISIYTRFLAEKKEDEAQKSFSVIITIMSVVLILGVIVTEIFAPQLCHWWFPKFDAGRLDLCVFLTRILLPAQLFFYVGGVVSAVLQSRNLFLYPAFGPVLYPVSIILGGVLLSHRLGIASLAYGAVAGVFVGPFLMNAIGAARVGMGFRISFDIFNPSFISWVKLSVPLMLGVSLVSADEWILRHFASGTVGDIARLAYSKRLFMVLTAVLGQATGQASLPFFARLFGEKKLREFSASVNGSVYRVVSCAMLVTGFFAVAALPLTDLLFRRGHFDFQASQITATYFFWFTLSLVFWAAQALYARAFYAAGDTLTPMIASSIILLASLPMYSALQREWGTVGLTIASDLGIAVNTIATAALLHRRKLVSAAELPWRELGKAAATALAAGALSFSVGRSVMTSGNRLADVKSLLLVGVTWAATVAAGLWITKSKLPTDLKRRRVSATGRTSEAQT